MLKRLSFGLPGVALIVALAALRPSGNERMTPSETADLIDTYCTTCHNKIDRAGELALDSLDPEHPALAGDVTVMRLLLDHGADPNIDTFTGTSPLRAWGEARRARQGRSDADGLGRGRVSCDARAGGQAEHDGADRIAAGIGRLMPGISSRQGRYA
jgi:hypothetical protein